jgi:hypothetical protein
MVFVSWVRPLARRRSLCCRRTYTDPHRPVAADVRLAEKNGKLIAYHGILTQRANFGDLLAQVKAFLTAPESSRETVVMSIQQGTPIWTGDGRLLSSC